MDKTDPAPTAALAPSSQSVAGDAPALWNPNAAVNWSLLFTPAFGAYLHWRNWVALNEPSKADSVKIWLLVNGALVAVYLGYGMIAKPNHWLMLGLLGLWYWKAGRPHANYVKEKFGANYPRRSWGKPLLIASGALIAVILVGAAILCSVEGGCS